jgi:NADH dehydrogenase (ubiquinone) 1 alpha subcomplex subunit 5
LPSACARAYSSKVIKIKDTTGIPGYPVVEKWRGKLLGLYDKTFDELQGIPEGLPYRQAVENLTMHHWKIVQGTEDYEVVEDTIGLGQVEQLIRMAECELKLIEDYKAWKLWETDESKLDVMDASFRTTIGGHYKKRAYEKMDEIEDEKKLLEQLQQEVEMEKVRVEAKKAEPEKTL